MGKIQGRGQVSLVTLMIGIVVFILVLAFAPVVKEFNDNARNVSSNTQVGLDCSNASISDFDKANCIASDGIGVYFVGFLMLFAGAIIASKIYGGGA